MKCEIYTDRKYKKYFNKDVAARRISGAPFDKDALDVDCVDSGLVAVDIKNGAFGIFDKNDSLVPSSIQLRGKSGQFIPRVKNLDVADSADQAIFLGNIYPHFGHFLLEHLNRAWGLGRVYKKGMKAIFIDNKNIGAQKFVFDFTDMLGIARSDVLILNKSVRFKRVYVPAQSWVTKRRANTDFCKAFDAMAENVPDYDMGNKIYVSRAALSAEMKVYGEERIQKIFEKNGYRVIYPEKLPLAHQAAIIKNAKCLAGCGGTALHLALFMRPGGRVIQIKRNSGVKDNGPIQWMLNTVRGLDSVFIQASVEKRVTEHNSKLPQIIGVTKYMRRFFDDNGFKYDAGDLSENKSAQKSYDVALAAASAATGGAIYIKFKRFLIKFVSCLVPGRVRRGRVRAWMKERL